MTVDEFDLERFVTAQGGGVYERALDELRQGRKSSHWMWFVFPQIAGLGLSVTSQRYAISGRPEAEAYLAHPVLGPRLIECAAAMLATSGRTAEQILGGIDAQKLHSSMTLFRQCALHEPVFSDVLAQYFGGDDDPATIARL